MFCIDSGRFATVTIRTMKKGTELLVWGALTGALVLGGLAMESLWGSTRPPSEAAAAADRAPRSALARESMSMLAPTLTNVYFGMTQPELQSARKRAVRQPKADEPKFYMFDESLPSKERVLYGIDNTNLRLAKVQIAGRLERAEDVPVRIELMQSRFGPPKSIWDCPALPGQMPTRRFMYQRSAIGAMDSFLMVGNQIAVTLYVAPLAILRQSLALAQCAPTDKEALARFPAVPLPAKPVAPPSQ